jgi:hypothetical protein
MQYDVWEESAEIVVGSDMRLLSRRAEVNVAEECEFLCCLQKREPQ